MAKAPTRATIRTYHVGFGDCFLISFQYARKSERHVLIDFGSTGFPKGVPKSRMMEIAEDIKQRTGGKLHAVVATHRHRDHISGFATAKARNGTGDIIKSLKPDLVVQPWTEDPKLAPNATGPSGSSAMTKKFGAGTSEQVTALSLMHEVASHSLAARNLPKESSREIGFLGESNIANPSAVKNLMTMARNSYVYCGSKSGLEKVLPGVKVEVLGPPTLKQTDTIRQQRSRDPDEFWHFQVGATALAAAPERNGTALFPRYVESRGYSHRINARWLVNRARSVRGEQLLQIVRTLDQEMNNTSVILLFQVGKKKLLFPGDAQKENWQYALGQKRYQTLLTGVNLYKVGHHGSLNATPKSLWKLFKNKSERKTANRLLSLMSTMEGKHGSVYSHTEVPRAKLVRDLHRESDLFTTQLLKGKDFFHDTVVKF
jgi:ribonuclease BN (tRNA processing enzyme)